MSTMHSTLCKKSFVGSHFWKKEIHFLFVLKFGMLHPRPPLALSAGQSLRRCPSYALDTLIGPLEACRRSHRRRRPPQYHTPPSTSRARHCLVFPAVKRYVTALTLPTRLRHRQPLCAPVAVTPWTT